MEPNQPDTLDLREQRAWEIFRFLRARTKVEFCHGEVMAALGYTTRHAYNLAFARARTLAREHNENITYCRVNDNGEQVFSHIYTDAEDGEWFEGSHIRNRTLVGQIVNHVDDLEWGSKFAKDPLHRLWAETNCTAMAAVVTMADQITKLGAAIREREKEDA